MRGTFRGAQSGARSQATVSTSSTVLDSQLPSERSGKFMWEERDSLVAT